METMEQKKTVSVSAFAKMAGISKAKVYSLIAQEEHKKYVSTENGLKMVDVGLLDVLNGKKPKADDTTPQENKSPAEAEEKPRNEYREDPIEDYNEGDIDETDPQEYDGDENRQRWLVQELKETSAMVRHLLGQLRKADDIIAEKDRQIHEMSIQLAEMAIKTQEITEKALNTVNQQQILTAIATKKTPWYKRLLSAGKEKNNA